MKGKQIVHQPNFLLQRRAGGNWVPSWTWYSVRETVTQTEDEDEITPDHEKEKNS